MRKNNFKIAVFALAGTIVFTSGGITANAKTSNYSPAAGIAVLLDEGTNTNVIAKNAAKSIDSIEKVESVRKDEKRELAFSNLVIAKVNNYVNVRSIPSESGEVVGKLYDKSVGDFIEEKDGWYKITSGKCTGYVKAEFCVTGEEAIKLGKTVGTTYATVNTTTLKVRKEANTDCAVLGLVPKGEELLVVEETEDFVKIAIEEGDGYVSKEYVDLRTEFVHAESKEEEKVRLEKEAKEREEALAAARAKEEEKAKKKQEQEKKQQEQQQQQQQLANSQEVLLADSDVPTSATVSSTSSMGSAVIDYALQFVGNKYVYGGTSLTNGIDCSGFVMRIYENFGVSLPHSSSALRSKGYDVGGIANAQPGDIVCYSGHVALYMGNGKIVHASNKKTGIIVSNNVNYRKILAVRRIF